MNEFYEKIIYKIIKGKRRKISTPFDGISGWTSGASGAMPAESTNVNIDDKDYTHESDIPNTGTEL